MGAIDIQNAKQIRDPMDVVITMEVPDSSVTLTYSGCSSAKVADGVLGQSSWPMRKLADLQGDGFVLDGTVQLYNPATSASAANGKVGVRGNIGQSVSVTITGNTTISGVTVFVTGSDSVTYNGQTASIVGTQVILPINANSATLTFSPSTTTDRIIISDIIPGTALRITNDSIISCVVSLRSDLSIIDPTLPESELNVEIYNDADISEQVANLPEDTPITYQAGYEGDMSPVRNFYVAGQVTWANNVLSIHAVDAVHFLDRELPTSIRANGTPEGVKYATWYMLDMAGVSAIDNVPTAYAGSTSGTLVLEKGASFRDIISAFMWSINTALIRYTYIDAGIPSFNIARKATGGQYDIYEEDCGDITKNVDMNIASATMEYSSCNKTDTQAIVGSADWTKNGPTFLSINDYTIEYKCASDIYYGLILLPNAKPDEYYSGWVYVTVRGSQRGGIIKLFSDDVRERDMVGQNYSGATIEPYAQVIPWNDRAAFGWSEMVRWEKIASDQTGVTIDLGGSAYLKEEQSLTVTNGIDGVAVETKIEPFFGNIRYNDYFMFPDKFLETAIKNSPVTGSFKWKGDPRMQPRDVVTYHRLDGTEEPITLENITITHVGGGTSAEITYRKGIV